MGGGIDDLHIFKNYESAVETFIFDKDPVDVNELAMNWLR